MKHLLVIFAALLLCLPVFAQDSLNVSIAGSLYDLHWEMAVDIMVDGSYAYVLAGGLHIVDISDVNHPVEVSSVSPPGFDGACLTRFGQYIVMGDYQAHIVDIADPLNPELVSTCDVLSVTAVAVQDNYLFVAEHFASQIEVFDISDPSNPANVNTINLVYGIEDLTVDGDYLYVAGDDEGLIVVDISDPLNAQPVAQVVMYDAYGVAVSGDYLYITCDNHGLRTFDISDPTNPVEVHVLSMQEDPEKIELAGQYAFLSCEGDGMVIVDLSDQEVPVYVSVIDPGVRTKNISVVGNYAFLANNFEGMRILDVSTPSAPTEVNQFRAVDDIQAVVQSDGYAYVGTRDAGMFVVDVSDPGNPVETGHLDLPEPQQFVVDGNYLYAPCREYGLLVVDINDPTNPQVAANVDLPAEVYLVHIADGTAFLGATIGPIVFVLDVTNPTNPQLISTFLEDGPLLDSICIDGDLAYFTLREEGLRIYDISDLSNPQLIGHFMGNLYHVSDMAQVDHYLLLAHGGLRVLDVSDPSAPFEVAYDGRTLNALDISLVGHTAFLACHVWGVAVFDITDPARPLFTGYYDTPDRAYQVSSEDEDYVCVADRDKFLVLDCRQATNKLIDITLIADYPLTVPQGGWFTYDALLSSNLQSTQLVDVWADVYTPSGYLVSPIWLIRDVEFTPSMVIEETDIVQIVPADAPLGRYTFRMKAGSHPGTAIGKDVFEFEVVPASGPTRRVDWASWGLELPGGTVAAATAGTDLPVKYALNPAWPNPFNATTTVTVSLPAASELNVIVYNVAGQRVAELAHGSYTAGQHEFTLDASSLASGLYIVRATVPGLLNQAQKMMLVR